MTPAEILIIVQSVVLLIQVSTQVVQQIQEVIEKSGLSDAEKTEMINAIRQAQTLVPEWKQPDLGGR